MKQSAIFGCVCIVCVGVLLVSCKDETVGLSDGGADDAWTGTCQVDNSVNLATAIPLAAGTTQTAGFVCPRTDKDYYKLTIPQGSKLLNVKLSYITSAAKLNLTYTVLDESQKAVAKAATGVYNDFKNAVHCLDKPGTYYLVVQDAGDDAFDNLIPYNVSYTVDSDKDISEPNDTLNQAKPLSGPATGYISCQGDVDYFSFSVGQDQLAKIELMGLI